jgi:acetyltransferase-like isoleucine patch superfamily enzyme
MDTDQHGLPGARGPEPVRIDDDVWIGCRAIIVKGVHIGRGAVIGAGAIVTKDVPAGGIAVGTPAHLLRDGSDADAPVAIDDHRKAGTR